MPSTLHEVITRKIAYDVMNQLQAIARNGSPAAEIAKQVLDCGSEDIQFRIEGNLETRSPDGSFWHPKAPRPGVVIEISYSQKRKALSKLADTYIVASNGIFALSSLSI